MALIAKRRIEHRNASSSDVVDSYIALYHELPEISGEINIDELETAHCRIDSSLHRASEKKLINLSAFVYSASRLPSCMPSVNRIIIAPSEEVFIENGYAQAINWKRGDSLRRRRRTHYDGKDILAIFVTSISDFDDVVPTLCTYQIEWNAMHRHLHSSQLGHDLMNARVKASDHADGIRNLFNVNRKDWELFLHLWSDDWDMHLKAIAEKPKKMIVERLPLRNSDFEQSVSAWFDAVMQHFSDIDFEQRPVYAVSSNTHGLANLISGYASQNREEIIADALHENIYNDADYIRSYWRKLKYEGESIQTNFLYYALRTFLERHPERITEKIAQEESSGVRRFIPDHLMHLEAQVIEIDRIDHGRLDPCLEPSTMRPVRGKPFQRDLHKSGERQGDDRKSEGSIIFNFDYPLGFSAYYLMKEILERMKRLRGIFILGKSAAMIGRLGDIMIPEEVRDAHSARLYRFRNFFSAGMLAPYLEDGAVFDLQRTLTVRGTFLHSIETVKNFRGDDFTGIEMEAGPYLSSGFTLPLVLLMTSLIASAPSSAAENCFRDPLKMP